jgi:hypothetical protein
MSCTHRVAASGARPHLALIRSFRISILAEGPCRLAIGAVPFLLPLMLQLGFDLDPLHSGLLTFVTSIDAMMMKTIVPYVVRRFGFRKVLTYNGVDGCTSP